MLRRCLPLAILIGLTVPVLPAQAEDTSAPSLVVRVRSLDGLLEDARYVVTLLGQGEDAQQFDAFIRKMIGPKGLDGIDTKKPFGFYGTVGPNGFDSTGVVVLPITDEKAFLGLLERYDLKLEKMAGGLYSFAPPRLPVTGYFRFANGYVYATVEAKEAVAKDKLREPATLFPANLSSTLSLTVRFDHIPNEIKQIVLQQMALRVADVKKIKLPDETDVQQEFRAHVLEEFARRVRQLLTEGQSVSWRLSVDRKAGEITMESNLTPRADTKLATEIAELSKSKSVFAGMIGPDSAYTLRAHFALPAELRKPWAPLVDEAAQFALEKEKDEKRRALAEKFLIALGPTFKAGDLDFLINERGPGKDGKFSVLLGVKLADGVAVEKSFRGLVKDLREEDQANIKFDVAEAGGVKIHMFDFKKVVGSIPPEVLKDPDPRTAAILRALAVLGENQAYMAFRGDAWLLAGGEGGLALIKEALATKPKEGPQFQFEMSVKRVALAMTRSNKDLEKLLSAFGTGEDNDKVRITLEGGKTLRGRAVVPSPVVKFLTDLGRAKKAAAPAPAVEKKDEKKEEKNEEKKD